MFDIFHILVPALVYSPRLKYVADAETSAAPGEKRIYLDGRCYGRMMRADEAYSNLLPWTGAPGRESWSALDIGAFANEASTDDVSWDEFLKNLEFMLGLHDYWVVTCEGLCEATDLEELAASPLELAQMLSRYRQSKECMSFRASSRGGDSDKPKLAMQ